MWPAIGGHEGAGVVAEVGPGVSSVAVGDHVSASFVPSCGKCRYCSTGRQNLCDAGAGAFLKGMITDGTSRHHMADGNGDPMLFAKLGTFANHSCVSEDQVIKVDTDLPLESVALVSCGVATGWGSATNRAAVSAGDVVVVVGIGGIGINAVQGAAMAGARKVIAVDPIEFKREKAMEFGATHTHSSVEEALGALGETTWDRGFDKVIMTIGVGNGDVLGQAFHLGGKRSKIVVTNIHPAAEQSIAVPAVFLTVFEKQLIGSLFGSANPRKDIPRLLELYTQGQLDLDGLVTRTYPLEDINQVYADLNDGKNIRGVLVYD